jgi:hypothetical protein
MRIYIILWALMIYILVIALTLGVFCKPYNPLEASEIKQVIEDDINKNNTLSVYQNKVINDTLSVKGKIINGDINIRDSLFNGRNEFINGRNEFIDSIEFINSTFNGDVNFINCTFKKPIKIWGCRFNQSINFQKSTIADITLSNDSFMRDVNFEYCTFENICDFNDRIIIEGNAIFDNSIFCGNPNFERAAFGKIANFGSTKFSNSESTNFARFNYSVFNGDALFDRSSFSKFFLNNAVFHGSCSFNDNRFYKPAYFKGAIFGANTNFANSKFYNISDFSSSRFGYVDFSNSYFNGSSTFMLSNFLRASFVNTTFKKTADFSKSQFQDKNETSNFYKSRFIGDATFYGARFSNDADFSRANFSQNVSFYYAIFDKDAIFDDAIVGAMLNLNKTEYKNFYIRLNEIKGEITFNETAYQKMISNFKNLGFMNDANECFYRYMKTSAISNPKIGFTSFMQMAAIYSYGFGVKPLYPLAWSLVIVLAFSYAWHYIKSGKLWPIQELESGLAWLKSELMQRKLSWRKSGLAFIKSDLIYFLSHSGDDLECSGENEPSSPQCSESKLSIENPLIFSIAIFLSGTKFFIDPPKIPKSMERLSLGKAKTVFIIERALGAIFSVLFLIALSKTIIGSS